MKGKLYFRVVHMYDYERVVNLIEGTHEGLTLKGLLLIKLNGHTKGSRRRNRNIGSEKEIK